MTDLFTDSKVITLIDTDFKFNGKITLINKDFKDKDGYIMIYAPWCPYCQAKVEFWSYLAEEFNETGEFANENFRIGAINSEDPATRKICMALKVTGIPRFIHVTPDKDGNGHLSDYQGHDLSPKALIGEVCQHTPKRKLCSFQSSQLNPPEFM